MEVYRQSKNYIVVRLALFGFLSLMFVGIPWLIMAIVEYMSSKFIIEKNGVILEKGIISKHTIDIPYSKINSIQVRQQIIGRMLNYGDIIVLTGNDIAGQVFSGIDDPNAVKAKIQKLIK